MRPCVAQVPLTVGARRLYGAVRPALYDTQGGAAGWLPSFWAGKEAALLPCLAAVLLRGQTICFARCHPLMWDVMESVALLQVQAGKMDPNYQHPLIHIYLLKRRKPAAGEAGSEAGDAAAAAAAAVAEAGAEEAQGIAGSSAAAAEPGAEQTQGAACSGAGSGAAESRISPQGGATAAEAAQGGAAGGEGGSDLVAPDEACSGDGEHNPGSEASARSEQQFKTRREGSMLARVLAEVKI